MLVAQLFSTWPSDFRKLSPYIASCNDTRRAQTTLTSMDFRICTSRAQPKTLVKKLLLGGANVNQVATLAYTWLDVDVESTYCSSFEVSKGFIKKGSTPLHFAVAVGSPNVVEILINREADVLAKDAGGLNPLERMVGVSIFDDKKFFGRERIDIDNVKQEIAEQLIRKITSILVKTKPDQMMYCYSLLEDSLLSKICKSYDESLMRLFKNCNITALHVVCFTRDLLQVQRLVDEMDVNARVDLQSPLWPGCTPLYLLITQLDVNGSTNQTDRIAKLLLKRGADVAIKNADGDTPLHEVFHFKLFRPESDIPTSYLKLLFKYLNDFSNPVSKNGFTHLHIACAIGAISIVDKLLKQGAEINQPINYLVEKYGGYTALHFAAATQQKKLVDLLLHHGAFVHLKSISDENVLHAVNKEISQPCLPLLRTLYKAGADIHGRNIFGDTPFENVIQLANVSSSDIDFFLENGCGVNTVNPINGEGFLAKALKGDLSVFVYVAWTAEAQDVTEISYNGRNAIHNVVSLKRPPWWAEDDDPIDNYYTPIVDYIRAIDSLIKLGLTIDHQDCKGMTPLHAAAQMQNITGIAGLLENGADINITDVDGKPSFAYSLEIAKNVEDNQELNLHILKVISDYIFRLNLARIGVSEANRKIDMEIRKMHSFEIPRVEEIKDEVDRMMKEQINEQPITFHELLSDTGAVSNFPYLLQLKREAIDYFFKNDIENLRKKFPLFTGILLLQYRKALARCSIVEAAFNSLDLLLGFHMPAVCSRIIFGYLSNDELNNLNSSTTISDE